MENGRLHHCKDGKVPPQAKTSRRLAKRTPEIREKRVAEHLATDYSQAPNAVRMKLKRVKPIVIDDQLAVDTELGVFALDEIMGVGNELPTPSVIADETAVLHDLRSFAEDVQYAVDVSIVSLIRGAKGGVHRSDE